MEKTEELLSLLSYSESNWVKTFIIILVIIPTTIGVIKSLLNFHNDYIRHFKLKNIEKAISTVGSSGTDFELLTECRNEELIRLNTKLELSISERRQVLEWLNNYPVTLSLIKRSESHLKIVDGILTPQVSRFEIFFMWYNVVTGFAVFTFGFSIFFKLLPEIMKTSEYVVLTIPVVIVLLALFLLKQAKPTVNARRLIHRIRLNEPTR